jgi:S1-C subfamily serine protease
MNASVKLIELVLPATVALKTEVADDHPSAQILGTQRLGTGVVVDPSGLILTVNYVVLGARSVEVLLLDETTTEGKVVAQDFASGVAVIEISTPPLAALRLCPSADLHVGQEMFIVAAAGENTRRANSGAITSVGPFDAYWEYSLERAITTTAMNPGVGGAPLLDNLGRVAGIVSLDLGEVGRFTLAIPTDPFLEHRDELLRFGRRVTRPPRAWVGFYCYTFREHVVIAGVLPGAPGEQAGLKAGDVVLSVNGERVTARHELYSLLWKHHAGALIHFRVFRNNHVEQLAVPSGDAEKFFA